MEVLDLGPQPLPNRLVKPDDPPDERYPLRLVQCQACRHVQLGETVSPEIMFGVDYGFQSGISTGWRVHCTKLAKRFRRTNGLAVDLGSNDGVMLAAMQRCGFQVVGVDPSEPHHDLPVERAFFNANRAEQLRERLGPADYITAMNVVAHVPDPIDFLEGIATWLDRDGTAYIEVPYVGAMLVQGTYDQIYHEHVHYWSASAMVGAAWEAGLSVTGIEHLQIHGGSLRFRLKHGESLYAVEDESMLLGDGAIDHFRWMTTKVRQEIAAMVQSAEGPVWAYGANAKGTMLINTIPDLDRILVAVDDNTEKHGYCLAGSRIPIRSAGRLSEPRTLVLTAWNWADDLMRLARERGFTGRFLIPFPEPRWA